MDILWFFVDYKVGCYYGLLNIVIWWKKKLWLLKDMVENFVLGKGIDFLIILF